MFMALRSPRLRIGVLLGMGFGVLSSSGSPWLRIPLCVWALLAPGQHALFASALGVEPLAPMICAALVSAAAAAPALARNWQRRAQPSPSTRL